MKQTIIYISIFNLYSCIECRVMETNFASIANLQQCHLMLRSYIRLKIISFNAPPFDAP